MLRFISCFIFSLFILASIVNCQFRHGGDDQSDSVFANSSLQNLGEFVVIQRNRSMGYAPNQSLYMNVKLCFSSTTGSCTPLTLMPTTAPDNMSLEEIWQIDSRQIRAIAQQSATEPKLLVADVVDQTAQVQCTYSIQIGQVASNPKGVFAATSCGSKDDSISIKAMGTAVPSAPSVLAPQPPGSGSGGVVANPNIENPNDPTCMETPIPANLQDRVVIKWNKFATRAYESDSQYIFGAKICKEYLGWVGPINCDDLTMLGSDSYRRVIYPYLNGEHPMPRFSSVSSRNIHCIGANDGTIKTVLLRVFVNHLRCLGVWYKGECKGKINPIQKCTYQVEVNSITGAVQQALSLDYPKCNDEFHINSVSSN